MSSKQSGFTLIESLVSLCIVGILATVCVFAFSRSTASSRVLDSAENIRTGLQFARAEAINRNSKTIFKLSDSGWNVWLPGEILLKSKAVMIGEVSVSVSDSDGNQVESVDFGGFGRPLTEIHNSPSYPVIFKITNSGSSCDASKSDSALGCVNVVLNITGQLYTCKIGKSSVPGCPS